MYCNVSGARKHSHTLTYQTIFPPVFFVGAAIHTNLLLPIIKYIYMPALPVRVRWVCCCWNETTIFKWILCGYFRIKNMTCLHYTTAVCNYYMVFVLYVMSARARLRGDVLSQSAARMGGAMVIYGFRAQDRGHTTHTLTHTRRRKNARRSPNYDKDVPTTSLPSKWSATTAVLKDSPSIIRHPLNARASSILDRCWAMVCFSFSLYANIEHVLSWLGVFLSGIIQLNAPTPNARAGA